MTVETVASAVRWLRDSDLLGKDLEVVWHAGEPLLAGLEFYERAHGVIAESMPLGTSWKHVFQTNGTLIDDEWTAFFARVGAQVGISIDGPKEWHDARRRTWGGRGSFDRILRSIECLKRHGVSFSTVTVLSQRALTDGRRLYDFLRDLGAETVGFNDEEREGSHQRSLQYESERARADVLSFYSALYELCDRDRSFGRVRELGNALEAIFSVGHAGDGVPDGAGPSEMSEPFSIVSVAFDGRLSTFAPELLGHNVAGVGEFTFGNVNSDSLSVVVNSPKFQVASKLVSAGVDQCRSTCGYFPVCGGGSPSNKYFENGRLDSTVTMFCQLSIMAPVDAVLSKLEREAAVSTSGRPTSACSCRGRADDSVGEAPSAERARAAEAQPRSGCRKTSF